MHNLYVQQCAALLDRSLRAVNSSIKERIEQWTEAQFEVPGWKVEVIPLEMGEELGPGRVYRMPFFDFDLQEGWFFCVLEKTPRLLPQHRVASTFFTEAAESEVGPSLKETTYNFVNTKSWMDVGLQILHASGWRPDCAVPHKDNIGKMLPPADPNGLLLLQSPTNWGMEDQSPGKVGYNKWMNEESGGLHITTCAFFQNGVGSSCAWVKRTDGVVYTQGWVVGVDEYSVSPPAAIVEVGVLHALSLVKEYLTGEESSPSPEFIVVHAGEYKVIRRLRSWFSKGTLRLQSAMASEIAERLREIIPLLKCALIINPLRQDFFEKAKPEGSDPPDIILGTAQKLYKDVLQRGKAKWGDRIARLPWTVEEMKAHLAHRYEYDEQQFIARMKGEGSLASRVFVHFRLTRSLVKSVFNSMRFKRAAQVMMGSLVCATRFKYYDEKGNLLPVTCPFCQDPDSFDHFLKCRKVPMIPRNDDDQLVCLLRNLALRAEEENPAQPLPIHPRNAEEIVLGWENPSDGEISLSM